MIRLTACFLTISICVSAAASLSFAAGYKISMLPRYSIEEIYARIVPLAEYLSKQTGLEITPTFTSTFDQYTKQLSNGGIDIGFQNPYIYVLASKKHDVIAMALKGVNKDKFRGIVITGANSPLRGLTDLEGKSISIVSYTSAGGYLSQKLTLQENGIDIEKACTLIEAPENKQENVIFSVFAGDVDAGFIRESALHKADAFVPRNALRVIEGTAWLPNWAVSVNRSMPEGDRGKIAKALLELKPGSSVLGALKINDFRLAKDGEYDVVRKAAGLDSPLNKGSME
ncbi:MAG TPA: phosphate/phosphite/phosphonate ABC transporter substrate-binding protein [Desulfocapsa sulfexigens]|nr:phosphate/phosphite/phosphonate ABC transporter substrate-binding protein [Desulfocapsa sulfexigens]